MLYQCVNVADQLAADYVTYAISTLNRAIPNAIDGLKVSQRRVIQSAKDLGLTSSGPFRKVSRLAGHVTGVYHPHGDASGSIVQLANASEFLYPLIKGHGNLGGFIIEGPRVGQKLSNDNAASARYLECKLSAFAEAVFDIEQDFLAKTPSYDGQTNEVVNYVPAIPLALINAQTGIGTGYATNTIAFDLNRIPGAIKALIKDSNVPSALGVPDFTSYGSVVRNDQLVRLHAEGKASIKQIGKYHLEDYEVPYAKRNKDRKAICITELPSGSAESFVDRLKHLVETDKVQWVADIQDLSSGEGIFVRIVLKQNVPDVQQVVEQVLSHTSLISTYSANNTFVLGNMPKQMTPSELLKVWYDARCKALTAKFMHEQYHINQKQHVLKALIDLLPFMHQIVELIMASESSKDAVNALIDTYKLDEIQASEVLSISLRQLVKLNADKLKLEFRANAERLAELASLLTDSNKLAEYVIEQASAIVKQFAIPRRTNLSDEAEPVAEASAPIINKTAREEFLESTRLNAWLAKTIWKAHNKSRLPKGLQNMPLISAANMLEDTLAKKLFFAGSANPEELRKFNQSLGFHKLEAKELKLRSKSIDSYMKHMHWSLNQLCK